MTINEYLEKTAKVKILGLLDGPHDAIPLVRPRIKCADGFNISAQANGYTYCEPRVTQYEHDGHWEIEVLDRFGIYPTGEFESKSAFTPYDMIELGFPSEEEPDILDYIDGSNDPTNEVYGYVPVDVVDKVLKKHGGIVWDEEKVKKYYDNYDEGVEE